MQHYYAFVYVRIMQALGAYGFRGFYERKAHFLQSVPYALKNVRWLLDHVTLPIALPTLMAAFNSIVGSEKLQALAPEADSLVVRIFSFSFHRGWPKDETGMAADSFSMAVASRIPGAKSASKPSREGRAGH